MSYPRFFKVDNTIKNNSIVKDYIDLHQIKFRYDNWINVERIQTKLVFDEDWLKKIYGDDTNVKLNANLIFNHLTLFIWEKYKASLNKTLTSLHDNKLSTNIYYDYNGNGYFYTMQRIKRNSSWQVVEHGKFYIVNIYKVRISDLNLFSLQHNYFLSITQKPTGVVIKQGKYMFESYGAKLRNLLTIYNNVICLIENIQKDNKNSEKLQKFLYKHVADYKDNMKQLIKFSKLKELEKLNIRDTEL